MNEKEELIILFKNMAGAFKIISLSCERAAEVFNQDRKEIKK